MSQILSENGAGEATARNQALVDELKHKKFLSNLRVEAAFRAVLRHLFLPELPLEEVYSDKAIVTKRIDDEWVSSSSQPAIMAIMLEQLTLQPGHRVLEIGAGTGYNAALMAYIVGETGEVITVDIDEDIVANACQHLAAARLERVQVVCADGGYGYPEAAPYDRIILTVGSWDILPAWWDQLKLGGRLVLPLELEGQSQKSIAFEKTDNILVSKSVRDCGFMQLRGMFATPPVVQVQLGTDSDLFLSGYGDHSVDPEAIYQWLIGTRKDWDTGVEIAMREVFHGLRLWLKLQEPDVCVLVGVGDMVDQGIVPSLVAFDGQWKSVTTGVLPGESGLAALMRPQGQQAPFADWDDLYTSNVPFTLFVRQFGPDESLAHRLIDQVRAWDDAGRPISEGLRIRAFHKDTDYMLDEGAFVIDKKWTRLVLDWP